MLEDENLVAHDDAHQRDEPEKTGQSQRAVGNGKAYHGTGDAQRNGCHADEGDAKALEVEQNKEEDDDQRQSDTHHDVGYNLVVLFNFATHFGSYTLGQVHLLNHLADAGL